MKCNNCGFEFEEGIFCPECGTKYQEIETKDTGEDNNENNKQSTQNESVEYEEVKNETVPDSENCENDLSDTPESAKDNSNIEEDANNNFSDNESSIENSTKKTDTYALWSLILAIATWPLILTLILWFPAFVVSIVFGINAIKANTKKKGLAMAGLIIDGIFVAILVISFI